MGAAENSRCGCSQKTRLYGHTTVVVVVLIVPVADVVVVVVTVFPLTTVAMTMP